MEIFDLVSKRVKRAQKIIEKETESTIGSSVRPGRKLKQVQERML